MHKNTNDTEHIFNNKEEELLYTSTHRGPNSNWIKKPAERVEQLLLEGVSPNIKNKQGQTPLSGCTTYIDVENVKRILSCGSVDTNTIDNNGWSPILINSHKDFLPAWMQRNIDYTARKKIFILLIKHGANIDTFYADTGKTVLHYLVKESANIESIKYLTEKGANIDIGDNEGNTPLMIAVNSGNIEIAEFLIEQDANTSTVNNKGQTLLMIFRFRYVQSPILKPNDDIELRHEFYESLLIKCKDSINSKDKEGMTALMYLANAAGGVLPTHFIDYSRYIEQLLKHGTKETIHLQDKKGQNALMKSILSYKTTMGIIKVYMEHSVDVNLKDCDGNTALMHLSSKDKGMDGSNDILALSDILFENGADTTINDKNNNKETAFSKAIQNGILVSSYKENKLDYIIKLIKKGAKYKNDDDTMQWYMKKENIGIVKYLVDNSKEKIQSFDMKILLKNALENNDFNFAYKLIDNGAKLNELDNLLTTAIRDAKDDDKNTKMIQFMLDNGANVNHPHNEDKTITALTMTFINKKDSIRKLVMEKDPDILLTLEYLLKNDLYFNRFDFEQYLGKLLKKKTIRDERKKISLLMKWSCFNQRVDVDKIDKCIYIIKTLEIQMNFLKANNPHAHLVHQPGQPKDVSTRLKEALNNSLHPIKHTTFKDVLKDYIVLPKHDPKRLTEILKKFSSDERLKYTNHPWDMDGLTYEKFIENARSGFDEIKNDLEALAPKLYKRLHKLIFSEENKEKWVGEVTRANIQKKIKCLLVIKQDDKDLKILKIFTLIKHKFTSLNINLDAIKSLPFDKIFLNRDALSSALTTIFNDIVTHAGNTDNNEIKVTCPSNDDTSIVIKITHEDATSSKSAESLKEIIVKNGGNFSTIKDNLTSVCDWSVEAVCDDGKGYKINYLHDKGDEATMSCSDQKPTGFTHILRFYR